MRRYMLWGGMLPKCLKIQKQQRNSTHTFKCFYKWTGFSKLVFCITTLHFGLVWRKCHLYQLNSKIENFPCQGLLSHILVKCNLSEMLHHMIISTDTVYVIQSTFFWTIILCRSGRFGRDRMVVGIITTYAIGAYHHWCCEFEPRSGRGVQHYAIKFVSDLRQVGGFLRVLRFPPSIKLTATTSLKYCWKWR